MGQIFSRIHSVSPTHRTTEPDRYRPAPNQRRLPVDVRVPRQSDLVITTNPKLPKEVWRQHPRANRADQSPSLIFRISRASFPHRDKRVLSTNQDKSAKQDITMLTLDPAEFPRHYSGRETPCCRPFEVHPDIYHPTLHTMKANWGDISEDRAISREDLIGYLGYASICQLPGRDLPAWCRHLELADTRTITNLIPSELFGPRFKAKIGGIADRQEQILVSFYWDSLSEQIVMALCTLQPDPPPPPLMSAIDGSYLLFVSEIIAIMKNHRDPRTKESFQLMIVGQGEMGKLAAVCGTINQVPFRAFNPTRLSEPEYLQLDATGARQCGETIIIESSRSDPRHPNVSKQEKKWLMAAGGFFLGKILLIPKEYRSREGGAHANRPDLFLRGILDETDPNQNSVISQKMLPDIQKPRQLVTGLSKDLPKVLDNQICCDTHFMARNGGSKGIHRVLVEQRLGVPVSTVLPTLSLLPDRDLNHFLHWIYSGQFVEGGKASDLKRICRCMGVDIEPRLSPQCFVSDMDALYSSRVATHDFTIISVTGKTFPVHRFVLAARFDVFYGLFSFSTDPSSTLQDKSCISDKSWEFLIRYMYLGEFDMGLLKRQIDVEAMLKSNWDYFQLRDDDLNLLFPDAQ